LEVFVDRMAVPYDLIRAAVGSARDDEHRASMFRGMHDAAAGVFVARTEAAMDAQDWALANRLLRALACLDPGSFIAGPIHHLGKNQGLPLKVRHLVETCEDLFKRASGRAPTGEGLLDAFDLLRRGAQ
jgi:hypothetical protein